MYKRFFYCLFSFTVLFVVFISFGLQAQIPNASFENWTGGEPDGWWTNNLFTTPYITQSSDAESGSSAAKGEVLTFVVLPLPPMMGSGTSSFSGFPVNQKYTSLNGYYKFHSVSNDLFYVNVVMWKEGGVIGTAFDSIKTSADNYTSFSTNINYTSDVTPDSCNITFAIYPLNSDSSVHLGSYFLIDNLSFNPVTAVNENNPRPNSYNLLQNYPNPFNPTTTIEYQIPKQNFVKLNVYNVVGEKVASLVNKIETAGSYSVNFNASRLSSGVYFYKLQAGNFTRVKKLILVK